MMFFRFPYRTTTRTWLVVLVLSLFCTTTNADAQQPFDLPWGDINVVILTDVHSWIAGHGDRIQHVDDYDVTKATKAVLNVDYGHVLSLYQHLQRVRETFDSEKDLFFVMNGDWIDGTGLAMNGDASHLVQLLQKMPFDLVNVGNHELYHGPVLQYITQPGGFVEWWDEQGYLSSNTLLAASTTNPQEPLGARYKVLQGTHWNVLSFGFLYNMEDHDEFVNVQQVQDAVQEQWFVDALTTETFDAILVLAHMDARDPLTLVLLNAMRGHVGNDMPIQFVTGHTHVRDVLQPDEASQSFEAGHYLDTVGFVSFPSQTTYQTQTRRRRRIQINNATDDPIEEGLNTTTDIPEGGTGEAGYPLPPDDEGDDADGGDNNSPPDDVVDENSTIIVVNDPMVGSGGADDDDDDDDLDGGGGGENATKETTPLGDTGDTTNETSTTIPVDEPEAAPTSLLFRYQYINANLDDFKTILGMDENTVFDTHEGKALSDWIARTRKELGLTEVIACMDDSYYLEAPLHQDDSLWRLFVEKIVPSAFQEHDVLLMDNGHWRYDLIGGGNIELDDVLAVAPYNETFFAIPNVPLEAILQLNKTLNDPTADEAMNNGAAEPPATALWQKRLSMLPRVILASPSELPHLQEPPSHGSSSSTHHGNHSGSSSSSNSTGDGDGNRLLQDSFGGEGDEGDDMLLNSTTDEGDDQENPLSSSSSTSSPNKYTLITNRFGLPGIQKALEAIDPQAAQTTPVALPKTTTQVWLDYIQETFPTCATEPPQVDEEPHSGSQQHPKHPNTSSSTSKSNDALYIGFGVVAILIVLVLAAINVNQRGVLFQQIEDRNQAATDEAFREFEQSPDGDGELL